MSMRTSLVVVCLALGACGREPAPSPAVEKAEAVASPVPAPTPLRAAEIAANVKKTRAERVEVVRRGLAPRLNRSAEGLEAVELPHGKRGIDLKGRFAHAQVVRVRPDGTRERGCFDNAEHAAHFMTEDHAP